MRAAAIKPADVPQRATCSRESVKPADGHRSAPRTVGLPEFLASAARIRSPYIRYRSVQLAVARALSG